MIKNLCIILLVELIFIFSSCEKEISPHFMDGDRKIVLNSIINPDSLISVYLSESIFPDESFFSPSLNTGGYKTIEGAKVELYDNDSLLGLLQYIGAGKYISGFKPKTNQDYSLKVTADKFPQAKAKTNLPIKIPIDSVRLISENENENVFYKLNIRLFFNDLPDVKNYYYLVVLYNNTKFNTFNFWGKRIFKSNDPVFLKHIDQKQYYIFDDELFDGEEYGLSLQLTTNIYDGLSSDTIHYHFYLCSINYDLYNYLKSYNKVVLTTDSDHNPIPLSEPVNFYNNIENGFGIFGGYQIDIVTLEYVKSSAN